MSPTSGSKSKYTPLHLKIIILKLCSHLLACLFSPLVPFLSEMNKTHFWMITNCL